MTIKVVIAIFVLSFVDVEAGTECSEISILGKNVAEYNKFLQENSMKLFYVASNNPNDYKCKNLKFDLQSDVGKGVWYKLKDHVGQTTSGSFKENGKDEYATFEKNNGGTGYDIYLGRHASRSAMLDFLAGSYNVVAFDKVQGYLCAIKCHTEDDFSFVEDLWCLASNKNAVAPIKTWLKKTEGWEFVNPRKPPIIISDSC